MEKKAGRHSLLPYIHKLLRRCWVIPQLRFLTMFWYKRKASKQVAEIPLEIAKERIYGISCRPEGSSLWTMPNGKESGRYDLSVIIPFYKTEQYARTCIDSVLFQKSDYLVEIILVNDGSPDNCGDIIDSYAQYENVVVVHQENQGVAVARNTGIAMANGEYLMFVDSDDWLAEGAIQALMQTAREYKADVVEGSHQITTNEGKTLRTYTHERRMDSGGVNMLGYPWGKVIRRGLFNNVCFPMGYWYEDSIIANLIYPMAEITITIPEIVLFYRKNPAGYTASGAGNVRSVDTYYVVEDMLKTIRALAIPVNNQMKKQLLRQLGPHLIGRVLWMDEEYIQAMFAMAKNLACENGLFPVQKTGDFFHDEFCEALEKGQYYRWKYAAMMS